LAPGNQDAGADQPLPACVGAVRAVQGHELGDGPAALGDDDLLAALGDLEITLS